MVAFPAESEKREGYEVHQLSFIETFWMVPLWAVFLMLIVTETRSPDEADPLSSIRVVVSTGGSCSRVMFGRYTLFEGTETE
jgi:hypothetical protein